MKRWLFIPQRVNFAPGRENDKGALDNQTPQRWFAPSAYVSPAAGQQGTAGRNTLIGPGFQRTDLSISKRFPVGRARMEFRGEIFNLLNRTNFGGVNNKISNANVATITTADEARSMQLGFRVTW
jgi:hypothetical protein